MIHSERIGDYHLVIDHDTQQSVRVPHVTVNHLSPYALRHTLERALRDVQRHVGVLRG